MVNQLLLPITFKNEHPYPVSSAATRFGSRCSRESGGSRRRKRFGELHNVRGALSSPVDAFARLCNWTSGRPSPVNPRIFLWRIPLDRKVKIVSTQVRELPELPQPDVPSFKRLVQPAVPDLRISGGNTAEPLTLGRGFAARP